jgi:hypothetical protein
MFDSRLEKTYPSMFISTAAAEMVKVKKIE